MYRKIFIIIFLFLYNIYAHDINEHNHKFEKTYKVGILKSWEPYYIYEDNKASGYAVELFELIASNMHLDYEYVVVDSWGKLWKLIEKKELDIVPNVGATLKRDKYLDFTQTTDLFQIGLYKYKTLESQDVKTIGVVSKNVCTKLIDESFGKEIVSFKSFDESLKFLADKKIDALCYPKTLVENSLHKLDVNGIEAYDEPLKVIKRSIGVLKGNEQLLKALDEELVRVYANGEFYKIYNKWFLNHGDIELTFEELIYIVLGLIILFLIIIYIIRSKHLLITKRELKSKIKEVNELNNRFILGADNALAGYWEWHIENNYLYLSKGWKKFLGYEEDEIENNFETFKRLIHPDDFDKTMNIVNTYLQKQTGIYKAKFRLKHKDKTYKWVSAVGRISEEDNKIFFGFHIDIDDLTTTKETLIAQSKSAMMGEMISAIAHQFKQPLNIISLLSSNQLVSIELEEEITKKRIEFDAKEKLKQVAYLSETIDTFRDFLKPNKQKIYIKIEEILEKSLAILDKSFKSNDIEINKQFSTSKEMETNVSELMQVFINILNNSKDAFKINNIEKRLITIKTSQENETVIVEIEDCAGGIPLDKIDNIFDAYFTTKIDAGGTGIGLYIVKTIIEDHYRGSIEAKNTKEGVAFKITLNT